MSSPLIRAVRVLTAATVLQVAFVAIASAAAPQAQNPHTQPATGASTLPPRAASADASSGTETGLAAVYSDRLNGHRTASGKRYHRNALTTAHKTLPFGTRIKVTNVKNHRTVELVVNDRGPKQAGRVLDVSVAAARKLGISRHGMAEVSVEVVGAAHHS